MNVKEGKPKYQSSPWEIGNHIHQVMLMINKRQYEMTRDREQWQNI